MFEDGVVTVFVSSMDAAVHFYTQVLGLKLENRFGDHWASVKAGKGLTIGLHPASADSPAGIKGSISIGLQVSEPIQIVVSHLQKRGAKFNGPIVEDKSGQLAFLNDPDGNPLYLHELKVEYRNSTPTPVGA
ncbi:MAG TPA: VOC family protein [Candidatus Acidoferrum sp.]|nr:VOC family protein [Candidatus Acidoferrum sp.]